MDDGTERWHSLVAALHEGVDDDDRWLAALDALSDALGGAAMFIGSTRRDASAFELSGHRVDPQWIELVNGRLAGHDANPVFAVVSRLLRENPAWIAMQPLRMSQLIAPDDYHRSAIYRDAIAPAGLEHVMVLVLDTSQASAISLTLVRTPKSGDFGETDGHLAAMIGPHLLGAMRLRYRFAIARTGALLLDYIDQPVLVLSEDGAVVHANREGKRLLAARDGLTLDQGRLRGATTTDSRAIAFMVSECGRAARGASLAPAGLTRLPRPSGSEHLVVRALPLAGGVTPTFGVGKAATVALIIHDPSHRSASTRELVGSGLGLSRAEAAVAFEIWEGRSVAEAAEALGLSPNTVKTHLKMIYERTGEHRQAGLVRRIAKLLADLGRDPD